MTYSAASPNVRQDALAAESAVLKSAGSKAITNSSMQSAAPLSRRAVPFVNRFTKENGI